MANFAVKVVKIEQPLEDHPNADKLSLARIAGFICISAKNEDGSHAYQPGDLVVYVPESAIVPEYLLKPGFWDDEAGHGILDGSNFDRVKARRIRGIYSQGILFPTVYDGIVINGRATLGQTLRNEAGEQRMVEAGDDVGDFLGIHKYHPPIPENLLGDVIDLHGDTMGYDFESVQTIPDLFTPGEEVVATEKLNGTNMQIGYVPGLNNPELFYDGNLYVSAKGLAQRGLVFSNSAKNQSENDYVRMLNRLLTAGLGDRLLKLSMEHGGKPVRVVGELYGLGVQKKFHYGKKQHEFAAFDIRIGDNTPYLPREEMESVAADLGLDTVPVLYKGPFDLEKLEHVRDGKDTLSSQHVREGIVITSADPTYHVYHGRKIGKWVSPAYALKASGEEFN